MSLVVESKESIKLNTQTKQTKNEFQCEKKRTAADVKNIYIVRFV